MTRANAYRITYGFSTREEHTRMSFEPEAGAPPILSSEKKPPRKPRPSELRKKAEREAAKAAATAKPKKKAAKKPAKRKPAKKASKPKTKAKPAKKRGGNRPLVRTERLDMRLSKAEKAKLSKHAKAKGVPITSFVVTMIARLK